MTKLCTLFSGSKGNSTYLKYGETSLLVDVGVSCKAVTQALGEIGEAMDSLSGILVTHEHSDHIKGLAVVTKRFDIPVYAKTAVLDYLSNNALVNPKTRLVPIDEAEFSVNDIGVNSFKTSHDSISSSGFRFTMPDGEKVGFATDLGTYTDEINDMLCGCNSVIIESNYDEAMLACSSYPYMLKRRIKSERGHLSNDDCANAVLNLINNGTKHIILAHLSRENNIPQLAYQTVKSCIDTIGAVVGVDYTLEAAPEKSMSNMITL